MSTTNQEKPLSAKEFTKSISPGAIGIRAELEAANLLRHVHGWLERYATQQVSAATKEKDEEIDKLESKIFGLTIANNNINKEIAELKSKQLTPERIAELMPSDHEKIIRSKMPGENETKKSLIDLSDEEAIDLVEIIIPVRTQRTKRIVRRRSHLIEVSIMGGSKFEHWIAINTNDGEIYESTGFGRNSVSRLYDVYKYLESKGYLISKNK